MTLKTYTYLSCFDVFKKLSLLVLMVRWILDLFSSSVGCKRWKESVEILSYLSVYLSACLYPYLCLAMIMRQIEKYNYMYA